MTAEVLIVAVLLGLIPAAIARNKGRTFLTWWIFGALLFIIALPMAIIAKTDERAIVRRGDGRQCPFCAEVVKPQAIVCRYCGREIGAAPAGRGSSASSSVSITDPIVLAVEAVHDSGGRRVGFVRGRSEEGAVVYVAEFGPSIRTLKHELQSAERVSATFSRSNVVSAKNVPAALRVE